MTEDQKENIWVKLRLYSLAMVHFFPVQLLLLHLKRSWLFLMFWVLLFGMAGGLLFKSLGIPYLFITPEYLSEVNPLSYFILGIVLGLFTMSFHIVSYIFYSHKFPFLATLSRPLYRFSFNNSVIPLAFYAYYVWHILLELQAEKMSGLWIVGNIAGLIFGVAVSVTLTFSWFFSTIRPRVFEKIGETLDKTLSKIIVEDKSTDRFDMSGNNRVVTYLKNFITVQWARDTSHYPNRELLNILQKHHSNAALFLIIVTLLMLSMSWFVDEPFLRIPAGASIVLIMTFYLMIIGAIYSRLKGWTYVFLIIAGFAYNYVSGLPKFQSIHYAFGLNYDVEPSEFTIATLDCMSDNADIQRDIDQAIDVLDHWKNRTGEKRPKLIVVNSSGGGLRSSLWSLAMLQKLDTAISGGFWNNAFMITGSSGGMVGTAYYRELQRENSTVTIDPNSPMAFENMGKDLLNPTGFTLVASDLFFTLNDIETAGSEYPIDRGWAFENQLKINTQNVFPPRWIDYQEDEINGKVPWMILAPTIINEGRRLMISNLGVSYLMRNENPWMKTPSLELDGVDFFPFFKNQRGDSIQTTTALRMSATFPYITPLISLPSNPRMEVIDAGARDNNGFELSLRFVYTLREWIEKNTSGVVFVQLLANQPPSSEIAGTPYKTRLDALIKPIGGVVKSFSFFQGFSAAEQLHFAKSWVHFPMDVVSFQLMESRDQEIALSWHLTEREKRFVSESARSLRINESVKDLQEILGKD